MYQLIKCPLPLDMWHLMPYILRVVNQHCMNITERPQIIMEREDYSATFDLLFEDFKARCGIHQYEMNFLIKDISLVLNAITDKAFYAVTDR